MGLPGAYKRIAFLDHGNDIRQLSARKQTWLTVALNSRNGHGVLVRQNGFDAIYVSIATGMISLIYSIKTTNKNNTIFK